MGEVVPGGPQAARVLTAEAARAALTEAATARDLQSTLLHSAEILLQRFGADVGLVYVVREGRRLFWAPARGGLAADAVFPDVGLFDTEFARIAAAGGAGLCDDLSRPDAKAPGRAAAFARGLRSAMWAPLRDEQGRTFGFTSVTSLRERAFGAAEVSGLEEYCRDVAWLARPAILLEEQEASRRLLEDEARLLAAMAEAESELELVEVVVDGVREALGADLALLMVESPSGGPAWLKSSPPNALSEENWAKAREALASGGNTSMSERSRLAGAFTIADLHGVAETPLELWMRDALGMTSLAAATRSHRWGGLGLGISGLRTKAGPWTESQRTFLARLARVLEISVERLRRGAIAVDHTVRLERQTEMLAAGNDLLEGVSADVDLENACTLISERLRETFRADHVAFGLLDLGARTRRVLGISSAVMKRDEFPAALSESDVAAYGPETALGTALAIPDLEHWDTADETIQNILRRGIRSLARAPFYLSDGTVGLVTLGSREPGRYSKAEAEQLLDLCRPVGVAIDRVLLLGRMAATTAALDTKTRILGSLIPGATVESAAQVFVEELRGLLGATHSVAAIFSRGEVRIAGIASDVLTADEARQLLGAGKLRADWREVVSAGRPTHVADLAMIHRGLGEDRLYQAGLRSIMGAPILDSSGQVRGMVTAGSPEARRWTEADVGTLLELSRSLGLICERSQLEAANEQRAQKIEALTKLLSTLNPQSEPEEVARLFARQVREYLGVDGVLVHGFDRETGQRVRVAFDAREGSLTLSPQRKGLGESQVYQWLVNSAEALYSRDTAAAAPEWLRTSAESMGFASAACVRLDAAGEVVGMIAAGSCEPGGVSAGALEILRAVAAPLGMVLERARATSSLRQQTQRTQAVLDILAALGPADSLEDVAGPVANALRSMYDADHCGIAAIDGELMALVGLDSAVARWPIGEKRPVDALLGAGAPAGPVVHLIADLDGRASAPGDPELLREGGMRSSMRVLIGPPAKPLGIVTVGSLQPARFSEADAHQLAQIVQPLAVATQYFRSRRESEQRTERLETTNRILTRLSAGGTPEHLARGFLAECRVLFGSRHALAVQFDHDTGRGRLLAQDTDLTGEGLPTEFLLEEMHSSRLVRQPLPQLVVDSRLEPTPNSRHLRLIEAGVYSAIRAPLVVHDTVRGAVSLWGEGAGRFTTEDAELLGTLTRPLALALEKASALESLGESELKYRSLVAQADEMIFLFEPVTLRLLDANSFTSRALGYSPAELVHLTLDRILDANVEEIERNVATAVTNGELHMTDARFLRTDGSTIEVDAVASMVTFGGREAVLVLARDVSERKALLRQLMQSQKMDSLGAMAGAVAHDFNNLLTTILGFAGLLKRSRNMDSEERENLALIEDAARRAADLTGRLLSFSRGGLVRFGRVDLRTVVEDTLQLAEPTMHAGLVVTRDVPERPVYVEGDAGQLQQALTNIVLNARDAMPEGGSVLLELTAEGSVAMVRILDTGPGMDEETRVRIFEPFYTTKPVGSGTGLGMAITYGIIQGHHGDISVESEVGRGTTFTISLPLLEVAGEDAPVDLFNAGEGNLVLVVDDDAMVRRTTTATLTELGYNVVEAPGGSTAVEIVKARPDRFSAVLLDLVMPGMTGSETFRALTAVRPDLPVVVCTGYAADSHIDTDVKRRIAGLVQKPFTAERLGRALAAAGAMPTRASRI